MPVSDLVRDLRKALGMTQDAVANRSGGKLKREYVVKVETGMNQATTDQMRAGFAAAFGVDRDSMAAYLDGELDLAGILAVARGERTAPPRDRFDRDFVRYPAREAAIAERGSRWLPWTVESLRSIGSVVPKDMSGCDKRYWIASGDELDRIVRGETPRPDNHRENGERRTAKKKAARKPKKHHAATG